MYFSTLALAALAVVSASPLEHRATCKPNFAGAGVSWSTRSKELASTSAKAGAAVKVVAYNSDDAEFRFEQTGQPDQTFLIKDLGASDNSLVVVAKNKKLQLATINDAGSSSQYWIVNCNKCNGDFSQIQGVGATGCTVSPANSKNLCVTASSSNSTATLTSCDGSTSQTFKFATADNSDSD